MIAVYTFAAWTVFVWTTRVRNIVGGSGSGVDLVAALVLSALGVAVAVAAWRLRARLAPVLAVAVGATVVAWAVRIPQIALDAGHGIPFKAVHVALAAVSLALAFTAWRTTRFWPARRGGLRDAAPAGTGV